ncbi:hypothetical protein AN958_04004 [Leucoagaricus sp. SymC.cos]|nr:hypothetical protein AN958_04004 [Leucoagaricus sp. SymC.cos]
MTSLGARSSGCLLNSCHRNLVRPSGLPLSHFSTSRVYLKSQTRLKDLPPDSKDKWNYNRTSLGAEPLSAQLTFKQVDANMLEHETTPPTGVKMLARDFIEDSLYNPHYGYFSKQVNIFDTHSIEFDKLRDSTEFQEEVAKRYAAYGADKHHGPGKQLWHTPTELFKPYYGQALARCLVSEYLLKYFPYEDFVIYEIGAGNGSLAESILDYLKDCHPDVYERTRYYIIEISGNLVKLQKKRLGRHHRNVTVVHQSIFHWKTRESAPCFFLAMEVVDNFAHDVVRYDLRTLKPLQGVITIDDHGDFDMIWTPVTDPLIASFLRVRDKLGHSPAIHTLLQCSEILRKIYTSLPFAPNLSAEEYIPTRLLSLLRSLRTHFPRHRLLLSDFSSLPDTIPGVNAPVVQTRFRNITVPCSTLMVRQGYFDIFFPTNFEWLRDIGLPVGERKSSVFTHAEFLQTYADLSKTTLRNGENPLVDFYKNVKFLF